jgi:uncharacterized protein (DUF302 family)
MQASASRNDARRRHASAGQAPAMPKLPLNCGGNCAPCSLAASHRFTSIVPMTGPVVVASPRSYVDTIARLVELIRRAGATIYLKLDQDRAAYESGEALRPTTVLLFGNPKADVPLMTAFPITALDLPLKIVVWEENGTVSVAYTPTRAIIERYGGVVGQNVAVAALDEQIERLVSSVAQGVGA